MSQNTGEQKHEQYSASTDELIGTTRYPHLPLPLKALFVGLFLFGSAFGIYYLFGMSFGETTLLETSYFYVLIGIFTAGSFLILPARKKDLGKIQWYDILLFLMSLGIFYYFSTKGPEITGGGWKSTPLGIITWLLMLEMSRRAGGWIFFFVVASVSLFPLFANKMPGFLWGQSFSFTRTIEALVFRPEGLLGLLTKVMFEILLGFLIFSGFLVTSGAGKFFMMLAASLLGKYRGGPAKVAVLASGFFGSLSGSAVSNVAAVGPFTIPTMKRLGYPPHYAGAIEACASSGGPLMPPVMGAAAFIMCEFLQIPYAAVIVAAIIPACLYYFGLLLQVDGYAGRTGLRGMDKSELPSIKSTLKQGWVFAFVLAFLIWGLLYLRIENIVPWYATALLILIALIKREKWLLSKQVVGSLSKVAIILTQTSAMVIPIGFVICGLTITGVTASFAAGVVQLGGNNLYIILILGIIACYIMGMAGLLTPAYVFMALTFVPAVLKVAPFLNPLSIHLFIMYYCMLSVFTPPVATSAFLAGAIAGAPPLKVALLAMRLGVVIYFIPFFFIVQPSLILQGPLLDTAYYLAITVAGIFLIAAGAEGYLHKIGRIQSIPRVLLVGFGLLLAYPEFYSTVIGVVGAFIVIAALFVAKRRKVAVARDAVAVQYARKSNDE